jgi:ATP-dependent Zn protease
MISQKSLEEKTNNRIDKIILGLIYYVEDEIFRKNYPLASDILDSLLHWEDIRGEVINSASGYDELNKKIDKIFIKIEDYKFKDD